MPGTKVVEPVPDTEPAPSVRLARNYGLGSASGAVVVVVLTSGLLVSALTNPAFGWRVFAEYFFSEPILHGVVMTLILTAISMFVAVALGTLLAIMRMSSNPILRAYFDPLLLVLSRHPRARAVDLLVQLRAAVFVYRSFPDQSGRHAVHRRDPRSRPEHGRLHGGGRARRNSVGRRRTGRSDQVARHDAGAGTSPGHPAPGHARGSSSDG